MFVWIDETNTLFVNGSLQKTIEIYKNLVFWVDKTIKKEYNATISCQKSIVKLLERLYTNCYNECKVKIVKENAYDNRPENHTASKCR